MLVRFKVIKLIDIDEFSDGCPYVRITNVISNTNNNDNIYKETGQSLPKNPKSSNYIYDDNSNTIELSVSNKSNDNNGSLFFIQVYCNSIKAKHTICYPGNHKLIIPLVSTSLKTVVLPLHEDGDEDLPIGDIELSYEVINNNDNTKNKAATEVPKTPVDKAKTTSTETPKTPTTTDKAKTTVIETPKSIDTIDKAKTASLDIQSNKTNSNKLIDEIENVDNNEQEDDIAAIDNIIKSKQKKKKKKKAKNLPPPPEWAINCQSTAIPLVVHEQLSTNESSCSRLVIRVHSAICTGLASLDPSSTAVTASLKVSLSPLPGKPILVKSIAGKPTDAKKSKDIVFDFQQKAVILNMGIGDLRSKIYKDGACPNINIELSFNGWTTYSALYYPTIATLNAGEIIAVPMVSNEMEATGRTLKSSIVLEINPMGDTSNVSVSTIPQSIPYKRSGNITMEIDGIVGKDVTDLDSNMKLIATLLASDRSQSLNVDINAFDSGLVIGSKIMLQSSWIDADVLEIKIGHDSFPDQSQGRIMIPLGALANLGSLEEGTKIECNYKGTGRWMSGTVSKFRQSDSSFDVLYGIVFTTITLLSTLS